MSSKKTLDDMFKDLEVSAKPVQPKLEKEEIKEVVEEKVITKQKPPEKEINSESDNGLKRSKGRPKGSVKKSLSPDVPEEHSIDKLFDPRPGKIGISITIDSDIVEFVDNFANSKGLYRSEVINTMLRYVKNLK